MKLESKIFCDILNKISYEVGKSFKSGDVVECINSYGHGTLVKGQTYLIDRVGPSVLHLKNQHGGYAARFKKVDL